MFLTCQRRCIVIFLLLWLRSNGSSSSSCCSRYNWMSAIWPTWEIKSEWLFYSLRRVDTFDVISHYTRMITSRLLDNTLKVETRSHRLKIRKKFWWTQNADEKESKTLSNVSVVCQVRCGWRVRERRGGILWRLHDGSVGTCCSFAPTNLSLTHTHFHVSFCRSIFRFPSRLSMSPLVLLNSLSLSFTSFTRNLLF